MLWYNQEIHAFREKKSDISAYFERTKKKQTNYTRYTSKITIVIIYFAFLGVVITREAMSKRNAATSPYVSLKSFVLLGFMRLATDLMYV